MRHIPSVAGREIRSLFWSPIAYVVLTLWALLAGFFFISSLLGFQEVLIQLTQIQAFQQLEKLNLNDNLVTPFVGTMWIFLLFTIPAITMGLFASERANGTQELLMTSPLTIWEIVLGKYLAAAAFVTLLVAIVAAFPGLLFVYGDPEVGKTAASLLGLLLVSLTYAAVGLFASSLTRNVVIAFFVALVTLALLLILPYLAALGAAGGAIGTSSWVSDLLKYLAPSDHFEKMIGGLVETKDVAYFGVAITGFLVLSKTAIESVRWR
jgi:ABC-2 type transport system permease protein